MPLSVPTFADGAVHLVGEFRFASGVQVAFHGSQQRRRGVGELAENRLTADHHDLTIPGNAARSPDQVFKLGTLHTRAGARRA